MNQQAADAVSSLPAGLAGDEVISKNDTIDDPGCTASKDLELGF